MGPARGHVVAIKLFVNFVNFGRHEPIAKPQNTYQSFYKLPQSFLTSFLTSFLF